MFKELQPTLPLPPEPVTTRWCTWLEAAFYYCDHFEAIKSVVDTFDSEDAESIRFAKKLFSDQRIKVDLAYIKSNFAPLVPATIQLETHGLALSKSVEIISSIRDSLNSLDEKKFGNKMEAVLRRNPEFKIFLDINNALNLRLEPTEQFVKDLSPKELSLYKYCPTTSADVERSFSMYKIVLTDIRRSFLFENLKKHCIVLCNREK